MTYTKVLLSSLFSAAALFIFARIMGSKQISQLTFFDYINGITIGSIAAEMATSLDKPAHLFILAMAAYTALSWSISFVCQKSKKARRVLMGRPKVIFDEGKFYRKALRKSHLDISEVLMLARGAGYFDLSNIKTAVLEYNGVISFLPKEGSRQLTPDDIKIESDKCEIPKVLIDDGNISAKGLIEAGLDKETLMKELKKQGFDSPCSVMLAQYNCGKINIFPYIDK